MSCWLIWTLSVFSKEADTESAIVELLDPLPFPKNISLNA
jgi:hypothetical protein